MICEIKCFKVKSGSICKCIDFNKPGRNNSVFAYIWWKIALIYITSSRTVPGSSMTCGAHVRKEGVA